MGGPGYTFLVEFFFSGPDYGSPQLYFFERSTGALATNWLVLKRFASAMVSREDLSDSFKFDRNVFILWNAADANIRSFVLGCLRTR